MTKNTEMFTPAQMLDTRNALVYKYGKKIITDDLDTLTTEEKDAKIYYQTLSKLLHNTAPETKALDQLSEFYIKQGVNSLIGLVAKYIVKIFWFIMFLAILLALLKFIFV